MHGGQLEIGRKMNETKCAKGDDDSSGSSARSRQYIPSWILGTQRVLAPIC